MRERFACEPGGCGARPGEPCVAYVRGQLGNPTSDVHAPRWRQFAAWASGRGQETADER